MENITSKDLCYLITSTLRLIDKGPMDHGLRVAYFLLKMLECRGGYVEYELAENILLAMIHDIGAYKTEDLSKKLNYETIDVMPHSIYGYLFMRYLSPMKEKSKILLYHHVDYAQLEAIDYKYKDIANFIGFSERVDLYNNTMGKAFDYRLLSKYEKVKYSSEAIQLFNHAQIKYDVFSNVKSGEYLKELSQILEYIIFNEEEKKNYIELLMYIMGFRSEYAVTDAVTTICICREIAKLLKVSAEDKEKLYYAALVHDIGMLTVSEKILDAPRALTQEETTKMRKHVNIAESVLKQYLDTEIVEIAITHHERSNGSGYYRGLKEENMNILQMILQIADTITGMINQRSYRTIKNKEFIINVLEDEANHGRFNKKIVKIFCSNYDSILIEVRKESKKILNLHSKLNIQYNQMFQNLGNN